MGGPLNKMAFAGKSKKNKGQYFGKRENRMGAKKNKMGIDVIKWGLTPGPVRSQGESPHPCPSLCFVDGPSFYPEWGDPTQPPCFQPTSVINPVRSLSASCCGRAGSTLVPQSSERCTSTRTGPRDISKPNHQPNHGQPQRQTGVCGLAFEPLSGSQLTGVGRGHPQDCFRVCRLTAPKANFFETMAF